MFVKWERGPPSHSPRRASETATATRMWSVRETAAKRARGLGGERGGAGDDRLAADGAVIRCDITARHDTTGSRQHRVTGRYLKQQASQAKPTKTESTTASNNITMLIVLILLPSCSPATRGVSRVSAPAPPALPHHLSEQCLLKPSHLIPTLYWLFIEINSHHRLQCKYSVVLIHSFVKFDFKNVKKIHVYKIIYMYTSM